MQAVYWLTFCVSNSLTRTIVHFFPASSGVAAPQSLNCTLSLFAQGIEPCSVTVEGARLSQPDGIRLEDAFPQLREGTGTLLGLQISLWTHLARLDLSGSACVIELQSQGESTRFWPAKLKSDDQDVTQLPVGIWLKDAYQDASLVFVNIGDTAVNARVLSSGSASAACAFEPVLSEELLPASVREIPLSDGLSGSAEKRECSWGAIQAKMLAVDMQASSAAAAFMLYRDTHTRRAIAVNAL